MFGVCDEGAYPLRAEVFTNRLIYMLAPCDENSCRISGFFSY